MAVPMDVVGGGGVVGSGVVGSGVVGGGVVGSGVVGSGVVGSGVVGSGGMETTLKRKREAETGDAGAVVGRMGAAAGLGAAGVGASSVKRHKNLDKVAQSIRSTAEFSPETSVTPNVGLGVEDWESPGRPLSSNWSADTVTPVRGAGPAGSLPRQRPRVRTKRDSAELVRRMYGYLRANVLAGAARKPGYRVMDVGCGKGTDLATWKRLQVREWLGVGSSVGELQEAGARYNALDSLSFAVRLVAADATRVPLWERIGPVATGGSGFDTVAVSQAAFQAACQSEAQMRMFLWNVASFLKPGASLVATVMDPVRLRAVLGADGQNVKHKVFSVALDAPLGADAEPDFGARYTLTVGHGKSAVSRSEFLLPVSKIKEMAKEFGLKLKGKVNFIDTYRASKKNPMFRHMLKNLPIGDAEWDYLRLFHTLTFYNASGSSLILDRPVHAQYETLDLSSCVVQLPYAEAEATRP